MAKAKIMVVTTQCPHCNHENESHTADYSHISQFKAFTIYDCECSRCLKDYEFELDAFH